MKRRLHIGLGAFFSICLLLFTAGVGVSWSYTISEEWIKPGIPDVDKPERGPEDPPDNSCAVASTANMLWAAGYRYMPIYILDSWSWEKADDASALYYAILETAYYAGYDDPFTYGWNYKQEKGWMKWYFQNNENEKDNLYKAVKYKENFNGLTFKDKQYLINELKRCQYVEIGIGEKDIVNNNKIAWYHSVTMVGFFSTDTGGTGTIIHDSDRDRLGTDDDYYLDSVFATDRWKLGDYTGEVWGYKTLCPVPEPASILLMGNALVLAALFLKRRRRGDPR